MKKFFFITAFILFSFTKLIAQTGCTDTAANNYNVKAKTNNGSCTYNNVLITPVTKYNINGKIRETSGLLWWNGLIWTFNDSGGQPALYAIDTAIGNITRTVTIANAQNIDWEDITQDDDFIYIGDFGNNASGNRKNLSIYKLAKTHVLDSDKVHASVINFSYKDQNSFTPSAPNHTNFDCEAMVAYGDSLFLFTKDWVDFHTRLYKLPKTPGTYKAIKKGEIDVQGLITGATILPKQKTIVLTGYNMLLSPFVYLLYDFKGNDFFSGNKRKVQLNEAISQTEGIAAITDSYFFISNEFFQRSVFTTPARLQTIDLSLLLNHYDIGQRGQLTHKEDFLKLKAEAVIKKMLFYHKDTKSNKFHKVTSKNQFVAK